MQATETEKTEKGEWVRPADATPRSYLWECSACGRASYWPPMGPKGKDPRCGYEFCPRCGIPMAV